MAAMAAMSSGTADGGQSSPGSDAGPPYTFETELKGGAGSVGTGLKDAGWLIRTEHGYRYQSGQQDSHLVVTLVDGRLRFADTGTRFIKQLSSACHRKKARGVVAVCRVPGSISVRRPLLIEIWPRLGNDYSDTSTLSAKFAVTALGDKGRDVAHFGAGPDFFNGFSGNDVVWGGAGNDWIRAGLDNDTVNGGPGNDDIVAVGGHDTVRGGDGADRLWAGEGDDRLWGDAGADFLLCGTGRDDAHADAADRVSRDCESVDHR